MKIVVTSEGADLGSRVDPRFGRCAYFLFIELDDMSMEVVKNPNVSLGGGAGIQSAQTVIDRNAKTVVTGNVGPKAFRTLKTAGLKVMLGGDQEMLRNMCRAKIHRATLNEADLNYVGSITIPSELMKTLDIMEGEQCDVLNVNTGSRFTTYAIVGNRDCHFCLNGAAARRGEPGDILIIMFYAQMEEEEARSHRVKVAIMDSDNRVRELLGSKQAD